MIRVAVLLLIAVTVNAAAPKCVKSFNKPEGDRIVSGRDAIPIEWPRQVIYERHH